MTRVDQSQIKENARKELIELERLQKNGSRTCLGAVATHNPQLNGHSLEKQKLLEDQLAAKKLAAKFGNPVVLDLNADNASISKARSQSKLNLIEGRKIKTSVEVRDP